MTKGLGVVAIVFLLLALTIGAWRAGGREATKVDTKGRAPAQSAEREPPAVAQHNSTTSYPDRVNAQETAPDYSRRFRAATNYLEFIDASRSAAEAGNPLAQLFIYRAFKYCRTEYPFYFRTQRGPLTLDEGMRRMVKLLPGALDYVRIVHERCHDVFVGAEPEMKSAIEWLRRASDSGEPRAQAQFAFGGSGLDVREGTRLLGTALRSRHPEVIMEISHHTLLLFGEDAPEGEHLAWQMAACERGAECGPGSDIVFFNCLFENRCQPYEGWIDILRRSGDFPAIETRAREINALIDAGEWEELGFGETISDP